jgi:uncharacterized protein (DUF302 family)
MVKSAIDISLLLAPEGTLWRNNDRFIRQPRNSEVIMYYIIESDKSFEQASADLASAVAHHGFGVLHVHDLGNTLRSKGIAFAEDCKIFEVCNPGQAAKVLSVDMRLNMALPCRISVFTEKGKTKIGLIKPVQILSALSQDAALAQVAAEVEEKTILMVEEAK